MRTFSAEYSVAVAAQQWGPMPGSDQEFEAEITVEEAYHGTQRSLTITGPDGCGRLM